MNATRDGQSEGPLARLRLARRSLSGFCASSTPGVTARSRNADTADRDEAALTAIAVAHHPARTASHSATPSATPTSVSAATLVAKYGYTMNARPAARCGHRSCFLPYTNSTNPTPPGMSERKSQVGSKDTHIHYQSGDGRDPEVADAYLAKRAIQWRTSQDSSASAHGDTCGCTPAIADAHLQYQAMRA